MIISVTAILVILAFICIIAAKFVTRQPIDLFWLGVFLLALVHLLGILTVVPR